MKDIELNIRLDGAEGEYDYTVVLYNCPQRFVYREAACVKNGGNGARISVYRPSYMQHVSLGEFVDVATEIFKVGVDKFEKAVIKGNKIELIKRSKRRAWKVGETAADIALCTEANTPEHVKQAALSLKGKIAYYNGSFSGVDRGVRDPQYSSWSVYEDFTDVFKVVLIGTDLVQLERTI